MPWEQTSSASFRARHDSADADDARRVLASLELTRTTLEPLFARVPPEITLVLHASPAALALSNPSMPLRWLATAPSGRPYVAGWSGRRELHVLSPTALRERASRHADRARPSREMLALSAAALYARRVIAESNPDLARVMTAIRARRELRWAWLLEGAARWFSGQTAHARAAIGRRLREGGRPSLPPGLRDAPLLGGTVVDLLATERGRDGERAVAQLATRLPSDGPRGALERAFGRRLVHVEGDWHAHLARLASSDR